jgi:Na+-transporting NADH:ubiquinone oxidoreductase subunit NqrB
MLYFLLVIVVWAAIGSLLHKISYHWYDILISMFWLIGVCWAANRLIARFLNIPANNESDYITALILTLILTPVLSLKGLAAAAAASIAAMAVKYVITAYRSHIFNPAALVSHRLEA